MQAQKGASESVEAGGGQDWREALKEARVGEGEEKKGGGGGGGGGPGLM